jgi:hypothetical protein
MGPKHIGGSSQTSTLHTSFTQAAFCGGTARGVQASTRCHQQWALLLYDAVGAITDVMPEQVRYYRSPQRRSYMTAVRPWVLYHTSLNGQVHMNQRPDCGRVSEEPHSFSDVCRETVHDITIRIAQHARHVPVTQKPV